MCALCLAFSILVLASHAAFAQKIVGTAEIKGQVYLSQNILAPAGTMVVIDRSDGGVVANLQTDSRGKFEVSGLEPRVYTLLVRVRGYESYQQDIDLTLNHHQSLVINLKPIQNKETEKLSPKGPADQVSARDAAIPPKAVKEFEQGQKLLVEKKDADGSAAHFKKAIELYGNFPQAFILLGVALAAQQKVQEAEAAYTHAISLDDRMANAYVGLGVLQNQQKKFAEAQRTLTRAVELKPDSFEAQYELGKSYWATGQVAESELHAQKAVQMRADFAPTHVLLGNIALRKNDPHSAFKEYNEYLRLEPNGPWGHAVREQINKLEKAAVPK
jgi:tetratricopeptide (TPR) repeat protein